MVAYVSALSSSFSVSSTSPVSTRPMAMLLSLLLRAVSGTPVVPGEPMVWSFESAMTDGSDDQERTVVVMSKGFPGSVQADVHECGDGTTLSSEPLARHTGPESLGTPRPTLLQDLRVLQKRPLPGAEGVGLSFTLLWRRHLTESSTRVSCLQCPKAG